MKSNLDERSIVHTNFIIDSAMDSMVAELEETAFFNVVESISIVISDRGVFVNSSLEEDKVDMTLKTIVEAIETRNPKLIKRRH